MIMTLPEDQLKKKMDDLETVTANWNGQFVKGLSISCGYATNREFPSKNIAELSKISDERMYAAKEEYYKRTGNARWES